MVNVDHGLGIVNEILVYLSDQKKSIDVIKLKLLLQIAYGLLKEKHLFNDLLHPTDKDKIIENAIKEGIYTQEYKSNTGWTIIPLDLDKYKDKLSINEKLVVRQAVRDYVDYSTQDLFLKYAKKFDFLK